MHSPVEWLAHASLRLRGYRSRDVETSVGRVHVLDARGKGDLPPTVLLHGFSSAAVHYLPLLHGLLPTVSRVIAPDLPGHGLSESPPFGVCGSTLRDGLFEALDAVLDEPAVLFGNSMGGLAAIHYALARPKKVLGLVLCSPGGAQMGLDELARFVDTFRVDSHDDALAFVDRLLTQPTRLRPLIAWSLRRRFQRPDMRDLLSNMTPDDLLRPEHLEALRLPVLLIWGRFERILPASHLEFFRKHLPAHARIDEPEHFGHSPYLDYPAALTRRLLGFLGEIAQAA